MTSKPIIKHICLECGLSFEVKQGSRKRYCDACMRKRIFAGKKIGA